MSELTHARVVERLQQMRLGHIAERLDALLAAAARAEPTYLDFLDDMLAQEAASKQRKRVMMGIQIAHFPTTKTLDDFDFKFQPSIDQKLVRELSTGRFVHNAENVLLFGPPGVGKTHLAIALGRAVVEAGSSVLFTTASLITVLAKAEADGGLADKLSFYAKPKLLIVDEYERGSMLITTNQPVTQWGTVFGDDVTASALLDRLLHHKLRALYQRKKGRDLFDLWWADRAKPDWSRTVEMFCRYMAHENHIVTSADFERNLAEKLRDRSFAADMAPLLRPEIHYDVAAATDHALGLVRTIAL